MASKKPRRKREHYDPYAEVGEPEPHGLCADCPFQAGFSPTRHRRAREVCCLAVNGVMREVRKRFCPDHPRFKKAV